MELMYNTKSIRNIVIDFYNLTKIRVAIFDTQFKEIFAYPERLSAFCKTIRKDSLVNEKCRECDYNNFKKCQTSGKAIYYKCHCGFSEIIVPIKTDQKVNGYIMCGQILEGERNSRENCWNIINTSLESYNLAFESIKKVFEKQSMIPSERIISAENILKMISFYISQNESFKPKRGVLEAKIDKFIIEHINEPIDCDTLCRQFNCRKTTFYKITNKIYGVSIMKHICHIKMQKAKDLLAETPLMISEISDMVGFLDYNYFTKVFKRENNCTPREYRNNSIAEFKDNNDVNKAN